MGSILILYFVTTVHRVQLGGNEIMDPVMRGRGVKEIRQPLIGGGDKNQHVNSGQNSIILQ